MDMHESYNKLVIARASLVPHVGYWHGSDVKPSGRTDVEPEGCTDVEPEGHRPDGSTSVRPKGSTSLPCQ